MKELKELKVRATGTCRKNRMNKCIIKIDEHMKKDIRGTYDYRFDNLNEVLLVTWKDNNCVKIMTNHGTLNHISEVRRWSRSEKKEVYVPQP